MGFKVDSTSGVAGLFGDEFNKEVSKRVREQLSKSHDMFKSIRITERYEAGKINFEFTRVNGKQITTKQREAIQERFGPILRKVIREVHSEISKK